MLTSRTLLPIVACATLLFVCAASLEGQPNAAGGVKVSDVGQWPMDQVVLTGGRVIQGLVRHESDDFVELVEIGRKPGRPMYLLVRWIPQKDVEVVRRLEPQQRLELEQRIAQFRNRTAIAATLHQQLQLSHRRVQEIEYRHYRGPWFSLASTADEELTREAIVRIEQMFAGYRTFLRPRKRPSRPLRLILLDSIDAYHDYQRRSGLEIKQPAYFDPSRNEIVAGGELAALAGRMNEIRQHHAQLLARYEQLEVEMQRKVAALTESFRAKGADDEQLRQLRVAARREWDELAADQRLKIRLAERANDALFQDKFRILYHEAFHAYLDNYVNEEIRHEIPRWLNEGWAGVFEHGLLDAGTLRLDAPDPTLLAALQAELRGDQPLALAELLIAPERQFLVGHTDASRRSTSLYLYSWGLAYYLTFHGQLLDSPAMEAYLDLRTGPGNPVERFEALVGMPLTVFQQQWTTAMLELKSGKATLPPRGTAAPQAGR